MALRYCCAKEDAALGPWPQGRDAAEDELHDFAGAWRDAVSLGMQGASPEVSQQMLELQA